MACLWGPPKVSNDPCVGGLIFKQIIVCVQEWLIILWLYILQFDNFRREGRSKN